MKIILSELLKDVEYIDIDNQVKIENVGGYGTRAAVVEAMRFLLLDFPYKIDYFLYSIFKYTTKFSHVLQY